MVHCRDCKVRTTHLAARHSQAFESLGRSHFVDKVQVDVNQARLPLFLVNNVGIPDFLEHSFCGHLTAFVLLIICVRRWGARVCAPES